MVKCKTILTHIGDINMNNINNDLKEYIEQNILPMYFQNEESHGIKHIRYVIARSLELIEDNELSVNHDIAYTIAAYHDIGHHIDSENHEKVSAQIMSKDKNLKKFFNDAQLLIIEEAIEDHRATAKTNPRTIYGQIVSSADRNNTVYQCLVRSYFYGKNIDPNATDQELYKRAHDVLTKKFGKDGYAKFYFKDKKYEEFLNEIRTLLADKETFYQRQDLVIKRMN